MANQKKVDRLQIMDSINAVSLKVLNFRDGDMIMLSDIQDDLNGLIAELANLPPLNRIAGVLYSLIDLVFKNTDWTEIEKDLVTGLDLLQKSLNELDEDRESVTESLNDALNEEITAYLERFPDGGEPQPAMPSKPQENPAGEGGGETAGQERALMECVSGDFYKTFSNDCSTRMLRAQEIILELDEDFDKNRETVNELFRIFHTIKGECGFINLAKIGDLTHDVETLLDILRNPGARYQSDYTDLLLACVDSVHLMIDCLNREDTEAYLQVDIEHLKKAIKLKIENYKQPIGELLVQDGVISKEDVEDLLEKQSRGQYLKKIGEIAVEEGKIDSEAIEKTLKKQEEKLRHDEAAKKKKDSLINVKASQVDYLTDMIQELWIAENQIQSEEVQKIKKITHEIQHVIMQLRTVEIRQLYTIQRRLIRDLSRKLGKEIAVEFSGETLEIDRNLVESLEEPLMHIIRNAVDHGIETPEERIAGGKERAGKISISAERKGNRILLTVRDDGKGLDHTRIREKALKLGLIDQLEAEKLSEEKVFELITMPGFSTAEKVSDVSGRGVGMDVVSSMISSFRGKLKIESEIGRYTSIRLAFPLNMAIIEGMVLEVSGHYFVIPVTEIFECIQMDGVEINNVNRKAEVLNIRGEIIPLIRLKRLMNDFTVEKPDVHDISVVVQSGQKKYALLVNRIIEKNQIAIKPLGKHFNGLRGVSGGTIFQGGKIGLILDIEQIIHEMT